MKHVLTILTYILILLSPGYSYGNNVLKLHSLKYTRLGNAADSVTEKSGTPFIKDSNRIPLWLNLDCGFSNIGLAADLSLTAMARNKMVYTVSFYQTSSESLSTLFQTENWTDFSAFNLMAGKVFFSDPDKTMFSVSAGLSYAVINYHTVIPDSEGWFGPSFTLKKVSSISFPVSLKMNIPTKTALGLTLELKMDINKEKSIFGLMAGLRIGRIKSRRM